MIGKGKDIFLLLELHFLILSSTNEEGGVFLSLLRAVMSANGPIEKDGEDGDNVDEDEVLLLLLLLLFVFESAALSFGLTVVKLRSLVKGYLNLTSFFLPL